MDRDGFWTLVEGTREPYWEADCEPHAVAIRLALAELPAAEIIAFDRILDELVWREAFSWNLWGAAYQLNGGCSDDGFVYFRLWLVGQGRTAFEAAVRDPDSLADLPFLEEMAARSRWQLGLECEDLLYVARQAYDQVTQNEMPTGHLAGPSGGPTGDAWDFEDHEEVRRRLPRLWARLQHPGHGRG